jgi:ankyrin repeat protein
VQALLKGSRSLNQQNSFGDTALIAASRGGHAEVCEVLLKAGANASLRKSNRATALDIAKARGLADVIKLLDSA